MNTGPLPRAGRLAAAITALTAVALLATACSGSSSEDSSSGEGSSSSEGSLRIAATTLDTNTFYQEVEAGMREAADKGGVILDVTNTAGDAARESQNLTTAIGGGIDSLVISPVSAEGSAANVRAATEQGIPVVCYNTCLNDELTDELVDLFVTTDQADLGKATGEYAAAQAAKQSGTVKIALLNCDRFEACVARKKGFLDALSGVNVEIVADQEGFETDAATSVAENILTANPDVDFIWAANEGGTVGATRAVETSGAKAKVFGTDFNAVIADLLLAPNPILLATTGQDPTKMGQLAVEGAITLAGGGTVPNKIVYVDTAFYSIDDLDAVTAAKGD